jgi:hypothetical protein
MSTLLLIPILTALAILALAAAVYQLRYRNATINDRLQRGQRRRSAGGGDATNTDDSIFTANIPAWMQWQPWVRSTQVN